MGRRNPTKGSSIAERPAPGKAQAAQAVDAARRSELPAWLKSFSGYLGSLQVAVFGLSATIAFLALGTMLESWYSAKIAQELVYSTWWFQALMAVLAINIFFAAVKKWPWKKHQIGFLVTHVGLELLLIGGVLNALYGTDAQMVLVDTGDREALDAVAEEHGRLSQSSDRVLYRDDMLISVGQGDDPEKWASFPFRPGSLPWGDTAYDTVTPGWIRGLDTLSRPLPKAFHKEVAKDTYLKVTAYYPHCLKEPYSEAEGREQGFPALKLAIEVPAVGLKPTAWIGMNPEESGQWYTQIGGGHLEILGPCPPVMLDEFLKPPPDAERGTEGQIVFKKNGETLRLDVAKQMGQKVPLGKTGWQVQLNRYLPAMRLKDKVEVPADPGVEFTFIRPDGKALAYQQTARWLLSNGPRADATGKFPAADPDAPEVWYHAPDWKFGKQHVKGVLNFVFLPGGKIYYRSFSSRVGSLQFESGGEAQPGNERYEVWGGMSEGSQQKKPAFYLVKHLAQAVDRPHYVPEAARPGLTRQDSDPLHAVLRCELTTFKRDQTGKTHSFTEAFQLPENARMRVRLRGSLDQRPFVDTYFVGYSYREEKLPFSLRLIRAEQQVDPGSKKAATYTSFVQLTDPDEKIRNENHLITMNEPLEHRDFKVYQANYRFLMFDGNGKPVNLSGLQVGRDPGLPLKYLGSILLALGIALMFYMKAYSMETMKRAFADRLGWNATPATLSETPS